MSQGQTYRLRVLSSRETPEAIYVNHPDKLTKFFYLPKSKISYEPAPDGKGWHNVVVPDWLAEEHGLL